MEKKKRKKSILIVTAIALVVVLLALTFTVIVPNIIWAHADGLVGEGKYDEAFEYVYNADKAGLIWCYLGGPPPEYYFNFAMNKYIQSGEIDKAMGLAAEYPEFTYREWPSA